MIPTLLELQIAFRHAILRKSFCHYLCLIFTYRDVNNNIMELLIMAYACKTSSARSIVGVIPYLPYSKQCKMRKRGCIVTKLLAKMMCKSGLTHIITMDLHQKEIQGFYECPVDNLRASPFLLQYIQESVSFTKENLTRQDFIKYMYSIHILADPSATFLKYDRSATYRVQL